MATWRARQCSRGPRAATPASEAPRTLRPSLRAHRLHARRTHRRDAAKPRSRDIRHRDTATFASTRSGPTQDNARQANRENSFGRILQTIKFALDIGHAPFAKRQASRSGRSVAADTSACARVAGAGVGAVARRRAARSGTASGERKRPRLHPSLRAAFASQRRSRSHHAARDARNSFVTSTGARKYHQARSLEAARGAR